MSVWLFRVSLIPQRWLDASGTIDVLFDEEGFDGAIAWRGQSDLPLEHHFATVLRAGRSWSSALSVWGTHDADRIEVRRERGRITAVEIYFDLRKPNMTLFHSIAGIAQELGLAVIVPALARTVPADLQQLLRVAAESKAAHYSLDPRSFLLELETPNARSN
jgi:hypothetical protein